MIRSRTVRAAFVVLLMMSGAARAAPESRQGQSWPEVKCARYKKAWSEALARRGTQGLGKEFLDSHEVFLSSGCEERVGVCPRTEEELELANIMVIAAMNAGTASTFPPFSCRK